MFGITFESGIKKSLRSSVKWGDKSLIFLFKKEIDS